MKTKIILLSLTLVLIAFLAYYFSYASIIQQQSLPVFVKVAPYIGLAVDKDRLHFGAVPKGGRSRRMLFLYNDDVYDKYVTIKPEGNIKQFLKLSDDSFKLASYENKTLNITIAIPKDAEYGNYSGNLYLYFRRF